MPDHQRIIIATDGLPFDACLKLAEKAGDRVYAIKVHNQVDKGGPQVVTRLRAAGAPRVWVDFKVHDISNTGELRSEAIREAGAGIVSVHASGEIEMMMAALATGIPEVFAITVLTSLSEEQAQGLFGRSAKAAALYLARLAKLAGVHGVVSSPQEVGMLSKRPELKGLKFITPGVRSPGKAAGDQQRIDTPFNAIKNGATHLVVGRQITQAADPVVALGEIEAEIALAFKEGLA